MRLDKSAFISVPAQSWCRRYSIAIALAFVVAIGNAMPCLRNGDPALLPTSSPAAAAVQKTDTAVETRGHEQCNHLDLYTVKDGKACFFTVDEWAAVPSEECGSYAVKGLVINRDGVAPFYLALHHSEKMTWYEAVERYGESALPGWSQCQAMAEDYREIYETIIAFGGDKGHAKNYWGKGRTSSDAWHINMQSGYVSIFDKTGINRVCAVAPVPMSESQSAAATVPAVEAIGHKQCNHLDLYTVKDGKACFFTVDEWAAVPSEERGSYAVKGVVVNREGVVPFCISLHDSREDMTWYEAVDRYGESALPGRFQCKAMAEDYQAIYDAIIAFGGDEYSERYWGKGKNSSLAWYVYMNSGGVYGYTKSNTYRVRTVTPVSVSELQRDTATWHEQCNHLDLYTVKGGKACFFTIDEWEAVPSEERGSYEVKGLVINRDGVEPFYLALHDSGEKMTWEEAVARYGESALPGYSQCMAMAEDHCAIDDAIMAFGGDKRPEGMYWGKSCDSSHALYVGMGNGFVVDYYKSSTLGVRTVAPVPLSEPQIP